MTTDEPATAAGRAHLEEGFCENKAAHILAIEREAEDLADQRWERNAEELRYPCPGDCGCNIGQTHPDSRECGCDSLCCSTFDEWLPRERQQAIADFLRDEKTAAALAALWLDPGDGAQT